MKQIFIIYPLLFSLLFSCKEKNDCPELTDPLVDLPTAALLADGKKEYIIKVSIPANTAKEKRKVKFSTAAGTLKNGKDGEFEKEAVKEAPETCLLIATATLVAPSTETTFPVTVTVSEKKYSYALSAVKSKPTKLSLSSSSFAVKAGFGSDITLTTRLTNGSDNVSAGYIIEFQDYYADGTPVEGQFKNSKPTTDNTSTASTLYSPGFVPTDTFIFVKAILLDNSFTPPLESTALKIFIIKNQ